MSCTNNDIRCTPDCDGWEVNAAGAVALCKECRFYADDSEAQIHVASCSHCAARLGAYYLATTAPHALHIATARALGWTHLDRQPDTDYFDCSLCGAADVQDRASAAAPPQHACTVDGELLIERATPMRGVKALTPARRTQDYRVRR